jgi:hypothetical protein
MQKQIQTEPRTTAESKTKLKNNPDKRHKKAKNFSHTLNKM